MAEHPNTDRFLEAFNRLEAHLRWELGEPPDGGMSFRQVLRRAEDKGVVYSGQRRRLDGYADLRNAVVHGGPDGKRQAEVLEEVADSMVEACRQIVDAAKVTEYATDPETCSPDDDAGTVAASMFDHDFSQVPVVTDGAVTGLLTSETIARWVGTKMPGAQIMMDASVGEVLGYQERDDHYGFVSRDMPAVQVVQRFADAATAGRPLHAVLVTHDGRPEQSLLGIFTAFDVAKVPR